jgi:hypothetical protein
VTGCQWLTDPTDGLTHAWRHVAGRRQWSAVCGREADPDTLTDPEDEFGRHVGCVLALGTALAEAQGDLAWRP